MLVNFISIHICARYSDISGCKGFVENKDLVPLVKRSKARGMGKDLGISHLDFHMRYVFNGERILLMMETGDELVKNQSE